MEVSALSHEFFHVRSLRVLSQARRDMDSMHSSSSSASELDVPEVQEVPLDGLGPMPRSSEKFRARGKHVLAYLQRLAQQNAELQARMEALEGRHWDIPGNYSTYYGQ